MRKHVVEAAALNVATQVRVVEDTIDAALTEIAELQARMVRARAAIGVGPATGQAALAKLGATLQGLIAARGDMAQCHGELAAAKQLVPGLRTVAYGDTDDCPPPPSGQVDLRIVA